MTKEELIYITLKQLKESFDTCPECLNIEEPGTSSNSSHMGPTIIWKFRVVVDGLTIPDPNNSNRTIIVTYNSMAKQLTVSIYFREINNLNHAVMADATATVKYSEWPWLHKSYRKFQSLREKLLRRQKEKENLEYLKKLSSIFPGTFEDDLLG
jgi:hypothetical protein